VAVGFSGSMAIILVVTSILSSNTGVGALSIWSITLVGLFNSILFPTIFALGVNGLGKFSLNGSAVLVMSIAGGAVIPFMVRNFSLMKGFPRELSLQLAFIIPVVCYAYIVLYGLIFSKFEKREALFNESPSYIV
jgi:FHS family L-fucose permease-like MFS transporter